MKPFIKEAVLKAGFHLMSKLIVCYVACVIEQSLLQ